MPRVKGGTVARRRRKKILKLAKGYFGSKSLLFRTAKEQVMKSYMYAYRDRRQKKRDFRKLWIARINAAARINGLSYSKFMYGLKCMNIEVNRKMLAEIAIHDAKAFTQLADSAKKGIEQGNKPLIFGAKSPSLDTITVTAGAGTKAPSKPKAVAKAAAKPVAKADTKPAAKADTKAAAKPAASKKVAPASKATDAAGADFNSMTVAELKALAKEKAIAIPSGSKKADIIALLSK